MPTNKLASIRYKILDELLSDRYHNYSMDDLTDKVNDRLTEMELSKNCVSRRTIEKDISFLENESPYYAEIERYSVEEFDKEKCRNHIKRCLRYAEPGFSIFKKEMTDDEKYLLSEAISMLGQFDGLPNFEALESFRLGLGVKTKSNAISFCKNPLENSSLIGELFTCITQKQVVEIAHHKFGIGNEITKTNVHPYLLKEYNRRWYLFGATERDNILLCFGLERIEKVTPLPGHLYIPYEGDINEYFDDIIGITNIRENKVQTIKFWVNDREAAYVRTKPLHDSQIHYKGNSEESLRALYPQLESGMFFSIKCKENYELIRELSSFGAGLVVLEPLDIRESVRKRSLDTLKMYEKLNK